MIATYKSTALWYVHIYRYILSAHPSWAAPRGGSSRLTSGASERGPPQRRCVAAEGAAVAGRVLPQAWWAASGGIAHGDSAAPEVEVAAEPSGAILCPGLAWLNQELVQVRGTGGWEAGTPPSPGPWRERAGWLKPAEDLREDWLQGRPAPAQREGEQWRWGQALLPLGSEGLSQAFAEPTVAERRGTAPAVRPHRLGLLPRGAPDRCMHKGAAASLTPWARAGEDGGSGLGVVPCSLLRMQRACFFCARSHREGSSLGLGTGATEGWAALGSLSPAQQQRILGKPGLGWAGPWGQAPVRPSTQGGLQRPGRPSWRTWPQGGGQRPEPSRGALAHEQCSRPPRTLSSLA